jgi:hypothetical protein
MFVDVIGNVRRAYFEQKLPINESVRTLSVSRATVRKVVRGHKTKFKYERGVQPVLNLGARVDVLTAILEKESKLPRQERRSTQRLFEEVREPAMMVRMTECNEIKGDWRRGWDDPPTDLQGYEMAENCTSHQGSVGQERR